MIRVCYSPISHVIRRREGAFVGTLSKLANEVTDVLGKNISYVTADEHGFKLQDGSHTGCMGEIEKGNADYALMYATAPVIGENLKQGPTIGYEQMHILTVYDSNSSVVKNLDVFDSINCFQLTTWGLIALLAAIVTLFVFLRQILFRLKHPITVIRDAKLVRLPFVRDLGWLTSLSHARLPWQPSSLASTCSLLRTSASVTLSTVLWCRGRSSSPSSWKP